MGYNKPEVPKGGIIQVSFQKFVLGRQELFGKYFSDIGVLWFWFG